MSPQSHNYMIIVGVGQVVNHWDGQNPDEAISPSDIAADAIDTALADTGVKDEIVSSINKIAAIRLFNESITPPRRPFGRYNNFPRTICKKIGLNPDYAIYSQPGGDQPQCLVNEMAIALRNGETKAALIVGAEANNVLKLARKNRHKLDWSSNTEGQIEDRGVNMDAFTPYELKNGMGRPPQNYALLENAYRHRLGMSLHEYRHKMSELLSSFSAIAETNPYAQFPKKWASSDLSLPSKSNYPISEPYLRWHIAQDSVNQSAALIMTTVNHARELGIDEKKWVYLHAHAQRSDKALSLRTDLSHSRAMESALEAVIKDAGLSISDINHYDIYSCFPIVVFLAAEYLKLDWRDIALTLTGGLPFFGGAGNNYSTHAIATMVEKLRNYRDDYGLVLANGGFLSKQAAGIYSVQPPKNWKSQSETHVEPPKDIHDEVKLLSESCTATIETYTITHNKFGANHGVVIASNKKGRIMAKVQNGHHATLKLFSEQSDLIGKSVKITHKAGKNYIMLDDKIGTPSSKRTFKHIKLNRTDHILEITLNRPKSYNALFSECHYELHEIFDAFERDDDLWVAVITGAGDKAFCSGNDLKVTAKGGNISTPPSGFGGLTNRLNREKPIIAAINGVAMGGGLEIVLACDIAIAEPHALLALPEVKVGLFAAAGGLQRLTRHIGRKAAMEMILTGRKISASEAKDLGIINRVTSEESAMDTARKIARDITLASPSAVKASKRVLNKMDEIGDLEEYLKVSNPIIRDLLKTDDFKEGVKAFSEKRTPKWVNK